MGTNLIIQKADGSLVPIQNRCTATRITSGKQNWALNAEDTLNITVESPFSQKYDIGDVVTMFGRNYKLNRLPKVKRTGMHEFSYDLEFEGVQYDLLRVTYDLTIDTTNNQLQDVQGDSLTGDLRRFMNVLIANANRVFPGKWVLGTCPETIGDKTLTFGESDNCLSVLQNLCGESNFNVEFEIETANGIHTINLKERVGQTLPYIFMYGKGNGLYALNRDNVSSSNIVTRLKVYGSTENITMKYRADRLCLPGKNKAQSYIEKPEAVAKYGVFEARKNFDNIKPTYTGVVSAVVAGNVLQFKDNSFPFDLNATEADGKTTKYLIVGVDAKVHFNTGNLAGYDFTVNKYDHATRTFTLNKLTDDRGDVFPSETSLAFQFGVGDEYKITDIAYSEDIEQAAENKLAEEANKYYDQNSQPKVQYGLTVTKEWLKSLVDATDDKIVNVFAPGDYLHIVDDDIDVDKSVRIKSFTRNILDPYDYTLTISDITANTQIINRVISDLVDIDKVLNVNNLKDPIRARANWRSSREVLDMVFDPEGDYYTDKIKPNSIDTLALSVGAKSMQFGLSNTVFQPNYNGNKNVVKWQGGVLTHYTINEETAVSWVLADGQTTLSKDSDAYYIYAKCAKGGQAGTIVFSKEQHKVNDDVNYYFFWVGVINSVDASQNARIISLTYGATTINGRFITTGRVQSNNGKCFIDLDENKFRIGNIESYLDWNNIVADTLSTINMLLENATIKTKLSVLGEALIAGFLFSDERIRSSMMSGDKYALLLDGNSGRIKLVSDQTGGDYSMDTGEPCEIDINAGSGVIETRNNNGVAYVSASGVFCNNPKTNALPSTTGRKHYGAIVGIGNGNVNGANNIIAGVYGRSNNTGNSPAYGGYFQNLMAAGLILNTAYINGTTYLVDQYTQCVGLIMSGTATVYLPSGTLEGNVIFAMQIGKGLMRFRPQSDQKIYSGMSEIAYFDVSEGWEAKFTFVRFTLNGEEKEVWFASRWKN